VQAVDIAVGAGTILIRSRSKYFGAAVNIMIFIILITGAEFWTREWNSTSLHLWLLIGQTGRASLVLLHFAEQKLLRYRQAFPYYTAPLSPLHNLRLVVISSTHLADDVSSKVNPRRPGMVAVLAEGSFR